MQNIELQELQRQIKRRFDEVIHRPIRRAEGYGFIEHCIENPQYTLDLKYILSVLPLSRRMDIRDLLLHTINYLIEFNHPIFSEIQKPNLALIEILIWLEDKAFLKLVSNQVEVFVRSIDSQQSFLYNLNMGDLLVLEFLAKKTDNHYLLDLIRASLSLEP